MQSPVQALPFTLTNRVKSFITAMGMLPAAMGLLILISWYAHFTTILQLRPNFPAMQYNTALCLLFGGAGLCLLSWGRLRLAQVMGGLVALFAGMTLYEYLCGFDLHIDQLFFHPYITVQTSQPGRMAPASALCLFQTGLALVMGGWRAETKWHAVVIGSMGSIIITICVVAILGYAINLPGTYGWGQLTLIALHTACALSLLGMGIFTIAWNMGRKEDGRAPHWLPIPVGLAVVAASVVFFQALESRQNQEIAQTIKADAEGVKSVINVRLQARIHSLERIAKRWEFSGRPEQAVWENDVKNYLVDAPDFQAIEWIDSGRLVRWIVPLAGNEGKLNQNLTTEERRHAAVQASMQLHEAVMTRVVELFKGGLGFVVYVPIYNGDNFDGWIAGVFKAQQMFDRYLPAAVAPGYAINISEGSQAFYERYPGPKPSTRDWVVTSTIEQREANWILSVWPGAPLVAQMNSPLPKLVLVAGIVFAILLAASIHLAQNASANARKTAAVNRELQTALDEVKTLSGLLPVCAGCKRVRDDGGYWSQIERYLSKRTDASFSHGICPECAVKFYEAEGMEVPEEVVKAAEEHHYD